MITDYIYMAGFFDGEGTVGLYRNTNYWRTPYVRASVPQKSKAPLEVFQKHFPGLLKITNAGRIWSYVINGHKAVPLLEAMLPYLIVKKEVALLGIELMSLTRSVGPSVISIVDDEPRAKRVDALIALAKELNAKGKQPY